MHFHRFLFFVYATSLSAIARAQIGVAHIGNAAPGNVVVGSSSVAKSDLPVCTPASPACSAITYIFTGNGNWNVAANWLGNSMPPPLLPSGNFIIIDPEEGGECILNVAQTIGVGGTLTILPSKRFRVLTPLLFLK